MEIQFKDLFKSLGINEAEAKVYLAALELGQASMQELSRKSGVKRTSIYNFIEDLIAKRLVYTAKKKKRIVYGAIHPNQLLEIEKARLVKLSQSLPEMLAIYNQSADKPKVSFFEGTDGINEVLLDMLNVKQPVVAFSDFKQMASTFGEHYFESFPPERARRGIVSKNIVPDSAQARKLAQKDAKYLRETRFLPVKDLKTEINIYGDKVALNSYRERNPFAVVIEDPALAETLRTIWQELWKNLDAHQ